MIYGTDSKAGNLNFHDVVAAALITKVEVSGARIRVRGWHGLTE